MLNVVTKIEVIPMFVNVLSRFLSSARSARQIRARPMPNFEELHEKWGRLMEHKKQYAYKPTTVVGGILSIVVL